MACKIKTLLQCKHCRHDLEFATVCGNRRVPLLWCPDCDILYQYLGPEEVIVDRSASVEYVRALAVFLGMTASNFSTIWNGRQPFQRKHIVRIAVRYQLSPQDVWDIFFLADAEAIKKEAREA